MPSYRVSIFKPQSHEEMVQHGPQTAPITLAIVEIFFFFLKLPAKITYTYESLQLTKLPNNMSLQNLRTLPIVEKSFFFFLKEKK